MRNSRTSRAGARLRWAGLFGLIAALSLALTPGVADAAKKKKKRDTVKVLSYNLYLGSDLADATNAGLNSRTDLFANEVGEVLREVNANDFAVRAQTIASAIKKNKADLVGLQEAALWKIEIPTDGGGPPRGTSATTPLIDYIDTLLDALNAKALTKKQCKKRGLKGDKCYRGYSFVIAQQEADVEQPGDFDDNPGADGATCDLSSGACAAPPGSESWLSGNDDTPGVNFGEPPSPPFPADANFDGTATDCPDGNPAGGAPSPPFGPGFAAGNAPVCMFHGIDGDLRLQMRDVILARKGAGVKTSNATSGNFSPASTFALTVFGQPLSFTRGWVAADVNVRGKKFHLVNTHLESEEAGTVREDQAAELVAPGGPATANPTVLIGDLNSDPNSSNPEQPPAFLRLMAAGFRSLTGPELTSGHGELLNDFSNVLDGGRIDHILTNSPAITFATSLVLDGQGGGLWASDHGGVISRLNVPGGKKKK